MARRQLDIRREVWVRERNLETIVICVRSEAIIVDEPLGREQNKKAALWGGPTFNSHVEEGETAKETEK